MRKKVEIIILVAIVSLAIFLRSYKITLAPPSLNWDEVSHGYNAYSILKTAKDEWGKTLPIIFRAYGDYKLPLYIYLTTLPIAIFGMNVFSVRFISLVAGIVSVILTYLLVKELFKDKKLPFRIEWLALLSSFLVSVEPWSLFLSRGAFEANLAFAIFSGGIYFFLRGLKKSNYFIISLILFGLSVWTYNSYRIFTPLFILILIYLYRTELAGVSKVPRRILAPLILTAAVLFVPMFYQLANPIGQARYGKVGILDSGAVSQIIDLRNKSNLSPVVRRLVYNRPLYFVENFAKNWVSHYSANFLFLKGGSNYQFNIPGFGLIYLADALFILVSIFYFLIRRSREGFVILSLFYFGPIASALTREAPHTLRSIPILPSPMILAAFGLLLTLSLLKKKKFGSILSKMVIMVYTAMISFSLVRYYYNYLNDYRINYSESWQYGYQQAVNFIKDNYLKYDKIIITKKYGEPHEFLLFYLKWNPKEYQSDPNLIRFYQSEWYWVDAFDKFYFVNDWDIPKQEWQPFVLESKREEIDCRNFKCLLITSPGNYPKGWTRVQTIKFLDGKDAFDILENH